MNKLCLAVGMSICLGLCGCGDDPDELFMKCKVAETSGEVTQEQLIDMYKAAVDAGSSDAAVYMAYYELTNNNLPGARAYAEKFKNDHPVDYNVINGVYLISDNLNKENAERGAELLSKAAKTNNVRTYYPLGEYYFKNKDYEKAVVNYELAVKNKDFRARLPLAKIYMDNLVPVIDKESVFRMIYQEQHDNSGRESDILLAKCFINGWGTLPNLEKARNLVKKYSSRERDLEAQFLELKIQVMNSSPEISSAGIVKMKDFVRMTNYPDAAYMLYEIYSKGLYGQSKNEKEAVHYVRIAQNYGNTHALSALARIYLDGIGVNKDENEAFSFARRAIEVAPSDDEAAYLIGVMYADGVGTKRDNELAYKYLSQAADAGNDDALYRKARMIQEGRAPSVNENDAPVIYEKLAKKDHPLASYQYGDLLFYGLGVTRDVNESVTYLKKAAMNGVSEAMFPLASAYDELGDLENALSWYKAVASSEDINAAEAAARIGDIYYEMHNYAEAEKYFAEAAEKEHVIGTENLGRLYYTQGRYEDAFKAFMKISKSSSYAQTFLGIMYERGQGVQKNDVYASEWYDKAVAKGSVDARYLEAQLYMNSKTLPDELKSQVLPLLTENACHGHRESVMFLATTYYPSSGNSEMGYGWLLYGARDLGMTDAASMVSKLQISRDYLEKAYEYAKNTCGQ